MVYVLSFCVTALVELNSPAYKVNLPANPRRMSTGGVDSFPEYSLAIADIITISVEENAE
jgi:hypothetical protein